MRFTTAYSSAIRAPYLGVGGARAHVLNDDGVPFPELADAIEQAMEFIDDEVKA